MLKLQAVLEEESSTVSLGIRLAYVCHKPCIIYLDGDLGTGKTTLCQSFLRALGHTGNIPSPTYTLVNSYTFSYCTVYHFDLYRLRNPNELEFIGIRDYFSYSAIHLVEWAKHGAGVLPTADITLFLDYEGNTRKAYITAFSAIGHTILLKMADIEGTLLR